MIVSNDVSVHWLDRAAFAARKSINVYRLPGAVIVLLSWMSEDFKM